MKKDGLVKVKKPRASERPPHQQVRFRPGIATMVEDDMRGLRGLGLLDLHQVSTYLGCICSMSLSERRGHCYQLLISKTSKPRAGSDPPEVRLAAGRLAPRAHLCVQVEYGR